MKNQKKLFLLGLLLSLFPTSGFAASYPTVPYTFVPRQIIGSAETNANNTAWKNSDSDGTKRHNLAELEINGVMTIDNSRNVSGNIFSASGNITTSRTLTAATANATTINALSVYLLNGTSLNTAGTLSNVAYLNQANSFTATQSATTINASSVYLLNGTSLNTAGTLSNVAYLNQANSFTATQNISKGLVVDTTTLIADETLNRVGIGISPLAKLHVSYTSGVDPALNEIERLDGQAYTLSLSEYFQSANVLSGPTFLSTGSMNFVMDSTNSGSTFQYRWFQDVNSQSGIAGATPLMTLSSTGALSLTGALTAATANATTINALSVYLLNGTSLNTAGTLSNVAYLNQANSFTATQSIATGLVVDTNTFYVDGTNNLVGIGNTAPAHALDVNRTGDSNLRLKSTSTVSLVLLENSSTTTWQLGMSSDMGGSNRLGVRENGILQAYFNNGFTATTINATTVSATTVTATGGIDSGGDGTYLKFKVLSIGDWNMDTTSGTQVNHGLTYTKIRHVSVQIRNDADDTYTDIHYLTGGNDVITPTQIVLSRLGGGFYDGVNYDSTSFNRGSIIVWYEP